MPGSHHHYIYLLKQSHILILQDLSGQWTLPKANLPVKGKRQYIKTVFHDEFSLDIEAERFISKMSAEEDRPVTQFVVCTLKGGMFRCPKKNYQQALWIKPEHILDFAIRGKMTLSPTLKSMLPRHYPPALFAPHILG